jgi:hypothetical protein
MRPRRALVCHVPGSPDDVGFFGSCWRPARPRRALPDTRGPPARPIPRDPAHSLRLRRPTPDHPSPIPLAENKHQVSRRPRQLSKVQSAGLPNKGNRPIAGAGSHRFAWPISRPERRSSETIYKAVPLPVLLSSRPVGREICQLVVDSPRMIHAHHRPVKGFQRAIFERPLTSTSSISDHPARA